MDSSKSMYRTSYLRRTAVTPATFLLYSAREIHEEVMGALGEIDGLLTKQGIPAVFAPATPQ